MLLFVLEGKLKPEPEPEDVKAEPNVLVLFDVPKGEEAAAEGAAEVPNGFC